MAKLGSKVTKAQQQSGPPPVILQAQPTGHIVLTTPAEIAQWEKDVHDFYGLNLKVAAGGMRACETCSGGCSDDCGLME
jgi:hypothetical protein